MKKSIVIVLILLSVSYLCYSHIESEQIKTHKTINHFDATTGKYTFCPVYDKQ